MAAVAFAAYARAEARSWGRPLGEGQQLALLWTFKVAFPAYLLATGRRRRRWLTVFLFSLTLVLWLWPILHAYLGELLWWGPPRWLWR